MDQQAEFEDEELRNERIAAALQASQRRIAEAQAGFVQAIITAHDQEGWTFRQIGEATGIAHTWAYKIYRRGKRR